MADAPPIKHSDKIKFERELMQATGWSRTKLRKELRRYDREQKGRVEQEAAIRVAQDLGEVRMREIKVEPAKIVMEVPPMAPVVAAPRELVIKNEGTTITATPVSIDFVGGTVNATQTDDAVTVTITPYALTVTDEGGVVPISAACTALDFVGSALTASLVSAGVVEVLYEFIVQHEESSEILDVNHITFSGDGVTVESGAGDGEVVVTIPGASGVTQDFDFFDGEDGVLKVAHYTNGVLTSITT